MHEVPELIGASILVQLCFELAGGGGGGGGSSIADRPFCFPTCFSVVERQKVDPNGVHSRMQ